jgi:hypothetical protein
MKKFVDGVEVDLAPEEIAEIEAWRSAPVPFAVSKAAKLAKFRADRLALLDVISGMGWAALTAGDTATSQALAAFRQGLLDLPQHATVTAANDIDGLSMAMAVRYRQLTDALPAAVKTSFKALI